MTTTCAAMRRDLEALVDGELRGAAVLSVNRHLQTCAACTAHADELRRLGDLLRMSAAADEPTSRALAGLASTVIMRTRAEDAESWLGVLRRAREDWHWMAVGAASVTATVIVTATVSALLAFGPKPQRADSLAAIVVDLTMPTLGNVPRPSDYLFADMTRPGSDADAVLMQIENGSPRASAADLALVANGLTNADVVDALFAATHQQRAVCAVGTEEACRQAAENLSTRVTSTMLASGFPAPNAYAVRQLRLLTSTKAVYDRKAGS